MAAENPVPGYLGRVLDDGSPVGTCFQVAPGVLVTAWHVLDLVAGAAEGAWVGVDPLAGGAAFDAVVMQLDEVHDLAVLSCAVSLPASAGVLAETDQVRAQTPVTVTGHHVARGAGRPVRSLTTAGTWAGPAMCEDAIPAGQMTVVGLAPGTIGAPVLRTSDGAVVGVVSGRCSRADGWFSHEVWVARTEDLAALLGGVASLPVTRPPLPGPGDLLLTVTAEQVRLTGGGLDVAAAHHGVQPALAEAVRKARRSRDRVSQLLQAQAQALPSARELSPAQAGQLLGESFLPDPVAAGLGEVLAAAERADQPVRLGLAVPPELSGLPWEALPGPGGRPLALHPLVSMYRKSDAAAGRALPGPLRVVVAIAAPDGGGPLLDYERELRNVLAMVRSARHDAADVRVLPFATVAAIRAELDQAPAHVLHICAKGAAASLDLEDEDGTVRPVTADELADLAIAPGRMPPLITLSACYTDTAAGQGAAWFAARLCQRGAAAVIVTETPVTDAYATRLLARVYGTLARDPAADVVTALAGARRLVEAELEACRPPRGAQLAGLGEWAAAAVLAATGSVPVIDPGQAAQEVRRSSRPHAAGTGGHDDRSFVGRRAELRRWPADLTGPGAGMVICGLTGVGKTRLAAELASRVRDREPGRVLVSLVCPLTMERLLGAVITGIRRELLVSAAPQAAGVVRALDVASRTDLGWRDRLGALREHVLGRVPVLVLIDNFSDNARWRAEGERVVGDQVLGELLAAWAADPGQSRLLIASSREFTLSGGAERFLSFWRLDALSRAESMKLAWSLPALNRLGEAELDQAWRLTGGHPRFLEYLDALLSGGQERYRDVTERLSAQIAGRLSDRDRAMWLAARTRLEAPAAGNIAVAAGSVLLDAFLTRQDKILNVSDLLLGMSVYREPVDRNGVLFQAGQADRGSMDDRALVVLSPSMAELMQQPAPPPARPTLPDEIAVCQAAGLLTVSEADGTEQFFVDQWVAGLAGTAKDWILDTVYRRAAAYYLWRARASPNSWEDKVHDLLEARHHLLHGSDPGSAWQVTEEIIGQLHRWGARDQEASFIHDTLSDLPLATLRPAIWIHQLGMLTSQRGDYDEAQRRYQRSLDIFERLGKQASVAATCHLLAIIAREHGDYDEAEDYYLRSLSIEQQLSNRADVAIIYHELGTLARVREDYDAEDYDQRCLDIGQRLGNQGSLAVAFHRLGILAQERGDHDEAQRYYQRCLGIQQRLGDQAGLAAVRHQLELLAQLRGDRA